MPKNVRTCHEQLLLNPFIVKVVTGSNPSIDRTGEQFKKHLEDNSPGRRSPFQPDLASFSTVDYYALMVSSEVSNLLNGVDRLEQIPYYIRRFPNTKSFQKAGITIHKWVQYHYANFLLGATGVVDNTLLLINLILALGLSPQECGFKTVTGHKNVQKFGLVALVKCLCERVYKYKEPRNLFAHRNVNPDLGLMDSLESERFLEESFKMLNLEADPAIHPVIRDSLYRSERRNLAKHVEQETREITQLIFDILERLDPIYEYLRHYPIENGDP